MATVRNNIKYYRRRAGLTQTGLADLAGVSSATVFNLEKSGSQPSLRVRELLSEALNISEGELCGYNSAYVSCSIALPPVDGDYLCAYKIHPRCSYVFQVLHFNRKAMAWSSVTSNHVQSDQVEWWMEIPKIPNT